MVAFGSQVARQFGRLVDAAHNVHVLRRSGMFHLLRPDRTLRSALAVRKYGPIAGAVLNATSMDPDAVALADERGQLTYTQLDRRSNALARALAGRGIGPGSVIAVLCRDHRGMVDTMLASAKLGSRLLLMNTGFSAPQLADVAKREQVSALVYDEEFTQVLSQLDPAIPRFLAWTDSPSELSTLDDLIEAGDDSALRAPKEPGGMILLTSGTTGTPKGAPRQVRSPLAAAHFLERVPLQPKESLILAAPLFHGTGISQFILSFALRNKVVLRRRFDPEATLAAMQEHRCSTLVVVPTMLQRILDLGPEVLARYDTSALRILFTAGSALSPELGNRATAAFGEVIHNLYGSTEVAVATVATPQDWREAPGTVGRAPHGCHVKLYDHKNTEITAPDVRGRIFVGSGLSFAGYTDGATKETIDGLLDSGDIGHYDSVGRLFVDGRQDDMIVSGGENVYPNEIEHLLAKHEHVMDAAVIGVADHEFGQRLRAFVVPAEDVALDADQVKEFVRANLARYKVPRDVVFLDELPRNATGKLLRKKLAEYEL